MHLRIVGNGRGVGDVGDDVGECGDNIDVKTAPVNGGSKMNRDQSGVNPLLDTSLNLTSPSYNKFSTITPRSVLAVDTKQSSSEASSVTQSHFSQPRLTPSPPSPQPYITPSPPSPQPCLTHPPPSPNSNNSSPFLAPFTMISGQPPTNQTRFPFSPLITVGTEVRPNDNTESSHNTRSAKPYVPCARSAHASPFSPNSPRPPRPPPSPPGLWAAWLPVNPAAIATSATQVNPPPPKSLLLPRTKPTPPTNCRPSHHPPISSDVFHRFGPLGALDRTPPRRHTTLPPDHSPTEHSDSSPTSNSGGDQGSSTGMRKVWWQQKSQRTGIPGDGVNLRGRVYSGQEPNPTAGAMVRAIEMARSNRVSARSSESKGGTAPEWRPRGMAEEWHGTRWKLFTDKSHVVDAKCPITALKETQVVGLGLNDGSGTGVSLKQLARQLLHNKGIVHSVKSSPERKRISRIRPGERSPKGDTCLDVPSLSARQYAPSDSPQQQVHGANGYRVIGTPTKVESTQREGRTRRQVSGAGCGGGGGFSKSQSPSESNPFTASSRQRSSNATISFSSPKSTSPLTSSNTTSLSSTVTPASSTTFTSPSSAGTSPMVKIASWPLQTATRSTPKASTPVARSRISPPPLVTHHQDDMRYGATPNILSNYCSHSYTPTSSSKAQHIASTTPNSKPIANMTDRQASGPRVPEWPLDNIRPTSQRTAASSPQHLQPRPLLARAFGLQPPNPPRSQGPLTHVVYPIQACQPLQIGQSGQCPSPFPSPRRRQQPSSPVNRNESGERPHTLPVWPASVRADGVDPSTPTTALKGFVVSQGQRHGPSNPQRPLPSGNEISAVWSPRFNDQWGSPHWPAGISYPRLPPPAAQGHGEHQLISSPPGEKRDKGDPVRRRSNVVMTSEGPSLITRRQRETKQDRMETGREGGGVGGAGGGGVHLSTRVMHGRAPSALSHDDLSLLTRTIPPSSITKIVSPHTTQSAQSTYTPH
eukprot:GHVN01089630.1.p1 GENE.GHVN01089630.1~~GHVN01089630.1.p1  ORF type:complete len:984 (-),score=230.85 GHVN01089630.1:500-3451(-)